VTLPYATARIASDYAFEAYAEDVPIHTQAALGSRSMRRPYVPDRFFVDRMRTRDALPHSRPLGDRD
jgi:hypothetical protein